MLECNCNYLPWLAVSMRDHVICISYIQKLKMKAWPLDTIVVLEIKPAELNLLWLLNDSAHQFECMMKLLLEDGTIIIDGIMKVPETEWKYCSVNPLFQNTSLEWTLKCTHDSCADLWRDTPFLFFYFFNYFFSLPDTGRWSELW